MEYKRPVYGDPTVKTTKALSPYGNMPFEIPAFELPISKKENFYRAARREKPCWVPVGLSDMQELHMTHLADKGPEGRFLGPNFTWKSDRFTYLDAFGNSWTWDGAAGGACMTPGTRICDDILKWEEQIKFPDLHEWNLEERAERYMKEEYDPERVMHLDIYHGPFQALADVLGGFGEALLAMIEEPEACRAFFDRFADWMIWLIDKLNSLYPADMFTVHDDWGTERDAFFSPKMMEEQLFEPTKRIIDHVHGLGKLYQFHCCGKIDRFMPYMRELRPDFMQLQRRVNDIPKYKELYGDYVGFNADLEGFNPFAQYESDEEFTAAIRRALDIYAPKGGYLPAIYGGEPEKLWKILTEVHYYSREMYEKEN